MNYNDQYTSTQQHVQSLSWLASPVNVIIMYFVQAARNTIISLACELRCTDNKFIILRIFVINYGGLAVVKYVEGVPEGDRRRDSCGPSASGDEPDG